MTEELTLLLLARWTRNLLALVGAYHVGRHIFLPGLVHFVNRCKDIERGDVEALGEAIARKAETVRSIGQCTANTVTRYREAIFE